MKLATFDSYALDGVRFAVNPATVETVAPMQHVEGQRPACVVFTICGNAHNVIGTFDEVVAALEAAGVPAVAPVVEVAPTDLEMAALLLEVVAGEIKDQELDHLAERINSKIGTRYDTDRYDGSISRLYNLAARLRGAR